MQVDDELGPALIAPPSYFELRALIQQKLGFPTERRPLLIGIDGADGSGKSSVASWLSWQLEMPAIHLDIYINRESKPLSWRIDDLARAIDGAQLAKQRPVIVEGVLLLRALEAIGCVPDVLTFVEKHKHEGCMQEHLEPYFNDQQPKERAAYILKWSSADHDAAVMQAHLLRR